MQCLWRNGSEIQFNIETHNHDDTWIGEVIFRGLRKNQNVKYYNCGKQGHVKRDCRQGILRNNVFSKNIQNIASFWIMQKVWQSQALDY